MPDTVLIARPALAAAASGHFGAPGTGVVLAALPEDRLWQALARPGTDPAPLIAYGAGPCPLRSIGPGQWLIVGEGEGSLSEAQAALAPAFALSDQSHGRVRVSLAGPRAADLLAKGTAVNLAQMPEGGAAQTLFGHIGITLARIGPEAFELAVLRGFALSLWDELILLGREYGIEARA